MKILFLINVLLVLCVLAISADVTKTYVGTTRRPSERKRPFVADRMNVNATSQNNNETTVILMDVTTDEPPITTTMNTTADDIVEGLFGDDGDEE